MTILRELTVMPRLRTLFAASMLPLAACAAEGTDDSDLDDAELGTTSSALGSFGEFGAPVNVGPGVNNASGQGCPFITKDDKTLYYASDEPGGLGALDIYVAHRKNKHSAWEKGVPVPVLNSAGREQCPTITPDGKTMFLVSDKAGGCGGQDIYISHRSNPRDDQGWSVPVNLGCGTINTASNDFSVAFLEGKGKKNGRGHGHGQCNDDDDNAPDRIYFSSNRPGGVGGIDIYTATIDGDGVFSDPENVAELNTASDDQRLAIRRDGKEVFFESNRTGTSGGMDLMIADRDRDGHFSNIRFLTTVNSTVNDGRPSISWDGKTLYWVSFRTDGTLGAPDIWSATRSRAHGHD